MQRLVRTLVFCTLVLSAVTAQAQWILYQQGDVRGNGRMYIDGSEGIVQSGGSSLIVTSDDGETWTSVTPPWTFEVQHIVKFDGRYYAYSNIGTDGFVRTGDSITDWERVPGLVKSGGSHGLATLATDGEVLWIRTFPNQVENPNGEYYTSSDGENWTMVAVAEGYGGYTFHDGKLYAAGGANLFTSNDYGATWEPVATLESGTFYSFASAEDRIYAAVHSDDRSSYALHASTDGGATWTLVRQLDGQPRMQVFDDNKLAIFQGNAVWITASAGQAWHEIPAPFNNNVYGSGFVADGYLYFSKALFFERDVKRAPFDVLGVHNEDEVALPATATLHPAYPNPFTDATMIAFDLAQSEQVTLRVYDVLGREVATLLDEVRPAGRGEVAFEGTGLAGSLYLVRLTTESRTTTQRVLLVR